MTHVTEPRPAPQPLLTRQRVVIALLLALAISGLVWAGLRTDTETPDIATTGRTSGPVKAQQPAPDTEVLSQAEVGVQLLPGYEGDLTIAGHVIPRDQLVGKGPKVQAPTPPDYIHFIPGEGQELERLPQGHVCAEVRYWRTTEGDAAAQTSKWCFDVT